MMRMPALADIEAAELRVSQARLETLDGLRRARTAFRATLARPVTLVAVAAASLVGFRLLRRSKRTTGTPSVGFVATAAVAISGLLRAMIVRHGMQYLSALAQRVWKPPA